MVLALVLSGVLASRLSRQITKPINNIDLENPRLDDAYEELFPWWGACGAEPHHQLYRWRPSAA